MPMPFQLDSRFRPKRRCSVTDTVSRPTNGNVTEPGVEPATCWLNDWGPDH